MDKNPHTPDDSAARDLETESWAREAERSLRGEGPDSAEVDLFLNRTSDTCARLHDRIEALTVAKVGLEAILSAYDSRYGEGPADHKDISLFSGILDEKAEKLRSLEAELRDQARAVEEFLARLDSRRNDMDRRRERFDELCQRIRLSTELRRGRLDSDRTKVLAIRDRYWPTEEEPEPPRERIDLPRETLHRVVDEVLERLAANPSTRTELIGQVLASVKDEDLRAVLSQKIIPSLDELPEVSDDEFWGE